MSDKASNPADGEALELPRGTTVRYFGDYELKRVLGKGGIGVVYKARQLSLNRLVALKMIRAGLWAGDDEVRRFRNEAEAVANLGHPRIVTIHEVGQFEGHHSFSMRVDGNGALSISGSIVGTPQSMSPEQAAGSRQAITTATDVYGLGGAAVRGGDRSAAVPVGLRAEDA
jgi:serine/threonine protein kinase